MAKKKTFKQFKAELLAEMWKRFGLTQNDSRYDTDQSIRAEFEAGTTIDECCDYLQEKDDLDRIDLEPFRVGTQRSPFDIGS
jgi:hypothetical protein